MSNVAQIIELAIFRSISDDRIVHVSASEEGESFEALVAQAQMEGDDYSEDTDDDGEDLCEVWGQDEDGQDWRVHVRQ